MAVSPNRWLDGGVVMAMGSIVPVWAAVSLRRSTLVSAIRRLSAELHRLKVLMAAVTADVMGSAYVGR